VLGARFSVSKREVVALCLAHAHERPHSVKWWPCASLTPMSGPEVGTEAWAVRNRALAGVDVAGAVAVVVPDKVCLPRAPQVVDCRSRESLQHSR
jgi:hypothetical protein